jgi:NADH-quinone oxidoreductase subunit K
VGVLGLILHRTNLLVVLMSIEAALLGGNLLAIFFSSYLDDILGNISALFVLTVAASESAIGLGLVVAYYKVRNMLSLSDSLLLRG